jgi:nitrate reductase delta subunit
MLTPFQKRPERADAAARVKRWVRERFALGDESTVMVTELENAQPGFPPLSTVIAFWNAERKHYHFRVFKPLEQVVDTDIPPAWYRDALAVTPGIDCGCC